MQSKVISSRVLGGFALCAAAVVCANGQIDETYKPRPSRPKIQKITRVVKVPEIRYQKISGLAITTVQPNAEVNIKPVGRGSYRQARKTDADGVLNLENVPPGRYMLTVSLDGYVTEESEIDVVAQRLVTVPVNLAPITHDIYVKTNVRAGEVRFAKISKGPGPRTATGGYCMVPIENGVAAVRGLQEGNYNLEIRPADVEYRPDSRSITVTDEELAKIENAAGRNELAINLMRAVTTEDFLANWLPNEWSLPSAWKVDNKRLRANGPGVALLQNDRYNHYRDFELKTNLRSLDNGSVGLVLRAVDDKNYYLIQLTGSAAQTPYFLTGYVIKDGRVAETFVPLSIRAYAQTIAAPEFFNLTITAARNTFRISLEDTSTGRTYVVGIIEDQNDTYPIGAIGIGTKDQSRFEVGRFHINYK